MKQQLRSAQVAAQWRGDTALTLPLFWRRSTVSLVFWVGARGRAFTLSPPHFPRARVCEYEWMGVCDGGGGCSGGGGGGGGGVCVCVCVCVCVLSLSLPPSTLLRACHSFAVSFSVCLSLIAARLNAGVILVVSHPRPFSLPTPPLSLSHTHSLLLLSLFPRWYEADAEIEVPLLVA